MVAKVKSAEPNPARILVGPAGWSYPDWKGILYPPRRPKGFHEAAYLADFFDTIEINTSFYHPLKPEFAAQWLQQVAANPRFLFTAKLWQKFTHQNDATTEDVKIVRAGFDILRDANAPWRRPAAVPFFLSQHARKSHAAQSHSRCSSSVYPLVVEVRHASWAKKDFYELLHQRGVGFCNIDQPLIGRSIKPSERVTSPIGYVRLHGRRYDTWFTDDPDLTALRALQLSILRRRTRALGQTHRARGRNRRRPLSSSPTIISKRKES